MSDLRIINAWQLYLFESSNKSMAARRRVKYGVEVAQEVAKTLETIHVWNTSHDAFEACLRPCNALRNL